MKVFKGETVSGGIALGPVFLQGYEDVEGFPPRIPSSEVPSEIADLARAVEESRRQIEELKDKHEGKLGESEQRIFDTHLAYLQDPKFRGEIERLVREERFSVRAAIRKVVADYDRIFQLVENDYLRQRASDFRDLAMRVLRNLAAGAQARAQAPAGRYILAARQLTTTDMFSLDNERVEGIVAEEGGMDSHAAILARSMGIPTITGVRDLPAKLENGDFVILDGGSGELMVQPDERLRAEYEQSAQRQRQATANAPAPGQKHATRDGTEIRLLASCGNVGEVNLARTFGMDGIGLFRTELLFLVEKKTPSEDMLVHHYKEVLRQPNGHPVNFRLLDVSSDMPVTGLSVGPERNPAMGLRGVRALLREGQLLRLQLRAILRAAAGVRQVAVLVPWVTTAQDLQRVRAAIVEERLALKKRGEPVAESLQCVPILEVPGAAFLLHTFLAECDFAVVAVDNLQAHLLGADRDNPNVREYYEAMHPAFFELVARMAREAHRLDKKLTLFGEAAADPMRLPFYLGVGLRSFSIAPVRLNGTLKVLRRFSIEECKRIAERVLEAPRSLDVQRVLVGLAER
ncbi:MAG: phosphoenolpyruvate--protein phosphotransferase [Planctomycetes bacterium]|nr:phosphoenolpyruvate--protein phosphotransferase [Planctomycetota bacterium]